MPRNVDLRQSRVAQLLTESDDTDIVSTRPGRDSYLPIGVKTVDFLCNMGNI